MVNTCYYLSNPGRQTKIFFDMLTIPCTRRIRHWTYCRPEELHCECSPLAQQALKRVAHKGLFIDLGSGASIDSRYFLEHGFEKGIAVDAAVESVSHAENLQSRPGMKNRFEFLNQRFSDFLTDAESMVEIADLVHSNFALPYHGRVGFEEMMLAATQTVKVGGVFSGVFFGPEDDWKRIDPEIALFTKEQVAGFFTGFDTELKEDRHRGHADPLNPPKIGEPSAKFWHIIRVMARRVVPVL